MTRPIRKAVAPARPKAPTPSSARRSPAERMLARSALLAREVLAAEPDDEAVVAEPATWPLVGSMLVH